MDRFERGHYDLDKGSRGERFLALWVRVKRLLAKLTLLFLILEVELVFVPLNLVCRFEVSW